MSQIKIWHFWVTGIERNICRCTFYWYSVITQFAKIAAGGRLCCRCTRRKLYHFKTFKSFSWKITNFELWHCCCKWAICFWKVDAEKEELFMQDHLYLCIKFAGSNPGEAVGFLRAKKILSTPSFGGEVKPPVPCRRFAARKRSLELRGSRILDEICRNISRPRRVPPSAARGLSRRWAWRHLAGKVGTSKGGGKQWQTTPKNLPRMQCARAIPVAWLGSGSC